MRAPKAPKSRKVIGHERAPVLESVIVLPPCGRYAIRDDESPSGVVSALDFHILRNAFKASIAELQIPETKWTEHATAMMRELTDSVHVDTGVIAWIIRK